MNTRASTDLVIEAEARRSWRGKLFTRAMAATLLMLGVAGSAPTLAEPPAVASGGGLVAGAAASKDGSKHPSLTEAVVVGASVSAGAEVALPGYPVQLMPTDATLADVLWAMTDSKPAADLASVFFFAGAERNAEAQLNKAKEKSPKVVVAIDFLFWHVYGAKKMKEPLTDDERKQLFERGLKRLEGLPCPVVVGDLPDMSHAISPFALQPEQVASKAVLEWANTRLADWAKDKKNVVVVPLKQTVAKAMAVEAVTLGGHVYEGAQARELLSPSGLHATLAGLTALAIECLDRMQAAGLIDKDASWERDPAKVKAKLLELKPPPPPRTRAPAKAK